MELVPQTVKILKKKKTVIFLFQPVDYDQTSGVYLGPATHLDLEDLDYLSRPVVIRTSDMVFFNQFRMKWTLFKIPKKYIQRDHASGQQK